MRNVMRLWRRSIQTRVVASTVLLSTMVIGATGWALLSDVADGLADSRRRAAIAEARSGFEVAQAQLDAAVESEPEMQAQALTQMVDSLTGVRGGRRSYELVLEGPLGGEDTPVRSSAAISPGSLPSDLRRSVIKSPGTYWSFSGLSVLGQDDETIVKTVEEGEDYLKAKFETALDNVDLPAEARMAVEEAWTSVKAGHDEMSALKHAID